MVRKAACDRLDRAPSHLQVTWRAGQIKHGAAESLCAGRLQTLTWKKKIWFNYGVGSVYYLSVGHRQKLFLLALVTVDSLQLHSGCNVGTSSFHLGTFFGGGLILIHVCYLGSEDRSFCSAARFGGSSRGTRSPSCGPDGGWTRGCR